MANTPQNRKTRIVILGGGFGGIYTFLHLRRFLSKRDAEIIIINKTNYFLFTPLLHEVATGGLESNQVAESIQSLSYKKGAIVRVADIRNVNFSEKKVETTTGDVAFDYLVIATGSKTCFYNVPGAEEFSMVLKDIDDAKAIRGRLINSFEKAVCEDLSVRGKNLTFVLVGGGATSVELAAEMAEFLFDTLAKFFAGRISREEINIVLVAGGDELLANFNPLMRRKAKEILEKTGVKIKFGARVVSVDKNGVNLSDGTKIESENVVWLGGVTPNVPDSDVNLASDKARGRILVNDFLAIVGQDNAYALGDVATTEKEFLPTHAQVAVREALVVAKNIYSSVRGRKPSAKFTYKPVGDLVSVGQWHAIGHIFGILWTGPLAWFIWRTVYLFKFASWPKRIKIAVDWTVNIFYPRDITRV